MKFDLENNKLLVLLVVTDLVFVLLHSLYRYTPLLPDSLYSLSRDRGYAEFFQYTKELWIAVLLLLLGVRQRQLLYFVFSALFIYFLIDDAMEFHERVGETLATFLNLGPAFGLRAVDFGELLVSGLFGLLFLLAIGIAFYLSEANMRRLALYLVGLIFLMAFFGILLDMVEIIIPIQAVSRVLTILEEAGEMLVMSVIVWFVYRINLNDDQDPLAWLPLQLRRGKAS
jgi:hypothetical protein